MNGGAWRFGEFTADRAAWTLSRSGAPVRLDPKPMALLFLLLERGGAVLSHDEALRKVWGEAVFVDGESAIYTAIKKIRRALGDNAGEWLQTVSGRGYRFTAAASQRSAEMRLAILPLADLSGDPGQEYFSDGLTEELIGTMARLFRGELSVIARTSVMRFKGGSWPADEIARELGVAFLMEGSVRRQGRIVRVTLRLLRAEDGTCLWSEAFEREADDVFALQAEIALAAGSAMRASLFLSVEDAPAQRRHTPGSEVYDLHLRARHLLAQRTRPSIEAAIRLFGEAIGRDADFAAAYAGLSCCHALLPITGNRRPAECFPEARLLAARALALDPAQADAYIAHGLAAFWYDWDWARARSCFRQAVAANPSESSGPMFLAHVHSVLGEHEEALATLAGARRLDPLSPIVGTHEGHFLYNAGCFEEALASLARVLELYPHFWVAYLMQGKALASTGRAEAAIQALEEAERFGAGNTEALGFRVHTLAASGREAEARAAMATLDAAEGASPMHRALGRLGLGDRDAALALIENGFAERDVRVTFLAVEARWRALGEATCTSLLARAGLPKLGRGSLCGADV